MQYVIHLNETDARIVTPNRGPENKQLHRPHDLPSLPSVYVSVRVCAVSLQRGATTLGSCWLVGRYMERT